MGTHFKHLSPDECKRLLANMSDFVSGEAADEVCAEIQRHVATCDDCRVMVDTLEKTITLYREHSTPDLPGEVTYRLFAALNLDDLLPAAVDG